MTELIVLDNIHRVFHQNWITSMNNNNNMRITDKAKVDKISTYTKHTTLIIFTILMIKYYWKNKQLSLLFCFKKKNHILYLSNKPTSEQFSLWPLRWVFAFIHNTSDSRCIFLLVPFCPNLTLLAPFSEKGLVRGEKEYLNCICTQSALLC